MENKALHSDYGDFYPPIKLKEIEKDYTIKLAERDRAKKILNDKYGVKNNGK